MHPAHLAYILENRRGLRLRLRASGKLRVKPRSRIMPFLRNVIREHESGLIEVLRQRGARVVSSEPPLTLEECCERGQLWALRQYHDKHGHESNRPPAADRKTWVRNCSGRHGLRSSVRQRASGVDGAAMKRIQPTIEPSLQVDYCRTVVSLSERGLSRQQVMDLGFPLSSRDDLEEAYKRGQAQGVLNVTSRLYANAMAGNQQAARLYLQARGGDAWSGLPQLAAGQPITLAAMRVAFSKEIEADD
jgi:hypothetical protein